MDSVSKIIIHEIKKEAQSNDCSVFKSSELRTVDEKATFLVTRLRKIYSKDTSLTYGKFDFADGAVFPGKFSAFYNSSKQENDFVTMCSDFVDVLSEAIGAKNASKGAYVVCCEYVFNGDTYIAFFLVRDDDGVIFEQTGGDITLNAIRVINTDKLAMACRISLNAYDPIDQKKSYISLTKGSRQGTISSYLFEALNVEFGMSNRHSTRQLYKIINQVDRPIDPNTNVEIPLDSFRSLVYAFATSTVGGTINLKAMGSHFYGNKNKLIDFANEKNISINNEFRPTPADLKKFTTVKIKADEINLVFPRNDLNSKVLLSQEVEGAVLIKSAELAKALSIEIDAE